MLIQRLFKINIISGPNPLVQLCWHNTNSITLGGELNCLQLRNYSRYYLMCPQSCISVYNRCLTSTHLPLKVMLLALWQNNYRILAMIVHRWFNNISICQYSAKWVLKLCRFFLNGSLLYFLVRLWIIGRGESTPITTPHLTLSYVLKTGP